MSTRILANRYELMERIGSGGMAVVYKARDRILNRLVAIKILKPEYTKDVKFIENFRRESQAAAGLSHPNIVVVYDVGREGNVHYIAMELVEGEALSELIEREGPLDYRRAVDISKQIASALSYAHKHQIIHRDVKPHNIMMTSDGTAKITDFGIAKAVNATTLVGNTGTVMGSVHYFSPEQARGGYVDEKSDIYSLGIVMYEMLTGKVPFDGDNPVAVALMHINDEPAPPSSIVSGIPPRLENIVMKAMDKIQVNRYKTADELIDALNKLEHILDVFGPDSPALGGGSAKKGEEAKDVEAETSEGPVEGVSESERNNGTAAEGGKAKKRQRRKLSLDPLKIAAVALAICCAIPLSKPLAGIFGGEKATPQEELITVPAFVGAEFEQAKAEAEALGLSLVEGDKVISDEYQEGLIVSQSPAEGTEVKKGKSISVNISMGVREGTVPKLVGSSASDVKYIIEKYNYKVGDVSYAESSLPEGIVVSQSPEAGAERPAGSYISYVVSKGRDTSPVKMPLLLGVDIDEAKSQLEDLGLVVGEISYGKSVAYGENEVMWQGYEADKMLERGTSVDLKVSLEDPEGSEDGEKQRKEIPVEIDYSLAENQVFYLTVTVSDSKGTRNIISNQQRTKDAGSEIVSVSGEGTGTVTVIIDNSVVLRQGVDFDSGETE